MVSAARHIPGWMTVELVGTSPALAFPPIPWQGCGTKGTHLPSIPLMEVLER